MRSSSASATAFGHRFFSFELKKLQCILHIKHGAIHRVIHNIAIGLK